MKYNINNLNEFEVLTLMDGLFSFRKECPNNLTDEEFNKLDNKIKEVFNEN